MNVSRDTDPINLIDLQPVKAKLIHKLSGQGWTPEFADAVEREYRRFLVLTKLYPDEVIAPSVAVDKFWHQHILDTVGYARDCQLMFGYFLHHNPYLGLGLEGDDSARREHASKRMSVLYEQAFGEPYQGAGTASGGDAAFCAATNSSAFCAVTAAAFCAATKAAFCAVTKSPAFCAVTTTSSAFCAVTGSDKAGRARPTGKHDTKRSTSRWCEPELVN